MNIQLDKILKIAFDHQIFTGQSVGGISRYFVRLGEEMLDMGNDVRYVAPIHRNQYLRESGKVDIDGLSMKVFPPKTTRMIHQVNQLTSSWLMRRFKPEIIHETYYSSKPVGCKVGAVRVLTVYDMIHEKLATEDSRKDQTSQFKRIAVDRADHIIAISHSTKNDLCDLFSVRPEKVSVVHLGFERFSSNNDTTHLAVHPRPFLLYVGQRGGYKNFGSFLRAVASSSILRDNFDIVAFGGGSFSKSEIEMIRVSGVSPLSVTQMEGDDSVLGALYSQAWAFVYPSLYEGFGLPPLEAMAHGCPVIVSNTSSLPEVVGDAGEYFDPSDMSSIAAAIERILANDERRNDLIRLGKTRLSSFSWRRCAEETIDIYDQAITKAGKS